MTHRHLGWKHIHAVELAELDITLTPARVCAQHRGAYHLLTREGEPVEHVRLTGRLLHEAEDGHDLPVVGDWVGLDPSGRIAHRFERSSVLLRKSTGGASRRQALAANIDRVFIVTSLNQDLNLRRLERVIPAVLSGGAEPTLVLSKADLSADPEALARSLRRRISHVEVLIVSAHSGRGLDALEACVRPGETSVFIGMSGVGKTTLLNHLAGLSRPTAEVRAGDDRGRHTTRHRELFATESGALIIDTPGIREFQLSGEEDLEEAFEDVLEAVEALAEGCRFRDCKHDTEPGCAVQAAIEDGALDAGRLRSLRKLERERAFQAKRRGEQLGTRERLKRHKKRMAEARRRRTLTKASPKT